MKILVVSHNVFSHETAMGKTLTSYFSDCDPLSIAQFYIHSEVPIDAEICMNYFRFTDTDAIKARIPFKMKGTVYRKSDIRTERKFSRTDIGLKAKLYQKGRSRTAGIYFLRNLIWKTAFWKTSNFRQWIREFSPDVVFFASGDYAFMYDIARFAADTANCPLVISCMDDYYLKKPGNSLFAQLVHRSFMTDVRKTMNRADLLVCMCDEMSRTYSRMFHIEAHTLYTGVEKNDSLLSPAEEKQISYVGNIGALRLIPLLEIGKALEQIHLAEIPSHLDIYSQERNPDIIRKLQNCKGIRFHGAISADEVRKVMSRSMLVVHVESMEKLEINPARYSISTKIPESLMNGPCLFAYGPDGVASIDYLKKNKAAYVVTSRQDLKKGLMDITENSALRKDIVNNARKLAENNHTKEAVHAAVQQYLLKARENYYRKESV